MGQAINIDDDFTVQVQGVVADVPEQSTLQFDYLLPFSLMVQQQAWVKDAENSWDNFSFQMFFELEEGVQIETIKTQLADVIGSHTTEPSTFNAHALKDWHLRNEIVNSVAVSGRIRYVRLFGIIGIVVLLIACVNFINIATARAERRSKEIGVRKAVGAGRLTLMSQFLGEAAFLLCISLG